MEIINILIITILAIATLTIAYKQKSYSNTSPGRLAWLPKYQVNITLPLAILNAQRPWVVLDELLAPLGFRRGNEDYFPIEYRRGYLVGDFSRKLVGLKLNFHEIPNGCHECKVSLEASWMVLFDTTDLWDTLQSVKQAIEGEIEAIWHQAKVDSDKPHITLTDAATGKLLALATPENEGISVEFKEQGAKEVMNELKEQLNFYFGSKQEPNPWEYAIHHCSTTANVYSNIRWAYIEPTGTED